MRSRSLLLLAAVCAACVCAGDAPRARSFAVEYTGAVREAPPGAQTIDFWMPVPQNDAFQDISNLEIDSTLPYHVATDSSGNRVLHVRGSASQKVRVILRFQALRREHRVDLVHGSRTPAEAGPVEFAQWLRPDRLVPLDDHIRSLAKQVVAPAASGTDLDKARAIYDHVVGTMKYDKSGEGWGRGDIYYACDRRHGNCTDFHAMFIGFARASGIPARFAIGLPLPAGRGPGEIAGYHCWAEFYARGIGWVPVDASEAAKDPSRRNYFFGAHDENRVEFTRGRDLELTPPQSAEPLNFFIYPYAEADGKPLPAIDRKITFRDLGT
jgi:transglutaminase-like putative cysteine protease